MRELLEYAVQGALLGVTYGLVALPIGLIYSSFRVIDAGVGSYAALAGIVALSVGGIAGIAAGLAIGAALATLVALIYQLLVRREMAEPVIVVTATFAVGMAVDSLILWRYGTDPFVKQTFDSAWSIADVSINPQSIVNLLIGLVLVALTAGGLFHTSTGRQVRASADNVLGALLAGIPVVRIQYMMFAFEGLLAAVAGVLLVYTTGLDFTSGLHLTLIAFGAAILFGLRGPLQCFLGGLAIGVVEALVAGYGSGGLVSALPFVFVLVILVASPRIAEAGRP